MKHTQQITTVFVAAMFLALTAFYACSKDKTPLQTPNPEEEIMSEADLDFQNQLVQFSYKVKHLRDNPDYKSGEVMSVDSVVWYIEALFNATYGFPDERYGKTQTDKTTVFINVNSNEKVSLDDVVIAFDEIINTVTQFYYQCNFEEKGFLLLDLSYGNTTENQLEIGLRSVIGEKSGEYDPFGPDDDWWYGKKKGDCEWNIGYGTTDAGMKLTEAINSNKPLVSPPPGYRFVYNSYDTINLFGHEYENDNGEKLIFYVENASGTFTWEEQCLKPEEMNFHFFGEREVIYNILPVEYNKPQNWTFMGCDLEGKQEPSPLGGIQTIHHQNELTYALRHLSAKFIIDPPIEL